MQLEFWNELRAYGVDRYQNLNFRKAKPEQYYNISIGKAGCHICLTINTRQHQVGCELYIIDDKDLFRALEGQKVAIENELSIDVPLNWQELPEKKASRVRAFLPFNFETGNRVDAFQWLLETALKFKKVFGKFVTNV